MKRIILKTGEERRIQRGHPWVYRGEIETVLAGPGNPRSAESETGRQTVNLEPGECADVESSPFYPDKTKRPHPLFLGRAIVNPESQITARIYSPSKEGLDKGFFKRRIREALERRLDSGLDLFRESSRIVFAEADFLPGLIVDRFVGAPGLPGTAGNGVRSWLSVQFLARGMDLRRDLILEALNEVLSSPLGPGKEAPGKPEGIVEKSAPVRELEGLPLRDGLAAGSFPEEGAIIAENGLLFHVDLIGGQKTGHFLDQKDNRRRTAEYAALLAAGRAARNGNPARNGGAKEPAADERVLRVLDCFCYTGGFAVHAVKAAVPHCPVKATAVDLSAAALELARKNAALNGAAGEIETIRADVFDFLGRACRQREQYDLIILDPPAFAKSRAALENALRGYKEINLKALKLLAKGGLLVTCSCSHAVDESRFKQMIASAAADAEKRIVQADFRCQGPDHPVLVGYDESLYLKCGFYRAAG
ncbi:MAG: class I SAM-dependent rRNA methyltransferase [Treponema sp.]|nr:class I SAM-dependent rRNA methyltransferase [Treponema sp.]